MTDLRCRFDNGVFLPWGRFAKACAERFKDGVDYWITVKEERSENTHKHYFACIQEAWDQLPHDLSEQFLEVSNLRKHALIRTGFCIEKRVTVPTSCVFDIYSLLRSGPEYCEVELVAAQEETYVVVARWAKSQSRKSMGKAEFQKSKNDTLDYLAALIGVKRDELEKNAGTAA